MLENQSTVCWLLFREGQSCWRAQLVSCLTVLSKQIHITLCWWCALTYEKFRNLSPHTIDFILSSHLHFVLLNKHYLCICTVCTYMISKHFVISSYILRKKALCMQYFIFLNNAFIEKWLNRHYLITVQENTLL